MKKIVVCPDSFKGSLGAKEIARIIAECLRPYSTSGELKYSEFDVVEIPLSDGGEGISEIMKENHYPIETAVMASDPLGRKTQTYYLTDQSGKRAFIESARIIGLPLLKMEERNPMIASSYGLGEVIKVAAINGCKEITVALGGSATCDGGEGMLKALGELSQYQDIKFTVVYDVTNPLLGENGAAQVFAPQKGAKPEEISILEARLKRILEKGLKYKDIEIDIEGGGAAGGLGFAFMTFLNANKIKGIDFVLNSLDFDKKIAGADLIITGEGKIDRQSLMGKVVSGVLERAFQNNSSIIAIAGVVEDRELLLEAGLSEIYEISNPQKNIVENMEAETARNNIRETINFVLKSNIF